MGFLKQAVGKSLSSDLAQASLFGWHPTTNYSTYSYYKENDFENGYASIKAIANEFMTIRPYTVDANGKRVDSVVIDKIYHPNQQMSAVDFREALAVMSLVHKKVHLLVWHFENGAAIPGGIITPDNIAGFTFLENAVETRTGKTTTYTVNGNTYTDDEVITLKGINPYNLDLGYSPANAARRWAKIDDYISDYQAGFFENGAVPAGQFLITAPTVKDFNDQVDMLQERHRGAGKNNNVTYAHRPIDPATQKPGDAQIEWVPFGQQNKDLGLKDIFEQVNKKIDSAYGVPASIRGVNDNNTYASVRVDQQIFISYAVKPFSLKVWTKFTHELNRITGGLGVAITFDLDVPGVADEEKVQSEKKQIDASIITSLVTTGGYSLDSIVDAFSLPQSYKKLDETTDTPETDTDNPDIDTGDEVADSPDADLIDPFKAIKQVAAREIPDLYTDLEIDDRMVADASLRGCIMLKVEPLEITTLVDGADSDLATDVDMDRSPVPAETTPHVTLLYGLLNNGNIWKDSVDAVLTGWEPGEVSIESIGYFELPDSYAIVAHIKKTTELVDAHDRLGLLPNAETFSEYKPHMTLAYINKDADLGKWLKALSRGYSNKRLTTTGIDYGDLPDETKGAAKSTDPKGKVLSENAQRVNENKLSEITRRYMEIQIDRALADTKAVGDATETQIVEQTDDMMQVIVALMVAEGQVTYTQGVQMLREVGLTPPESLAYTVSQRAITNYRLYLLDIVNNYTTDTAVSIRNVLDMANVNGWTRAQLTTGLRNIMNTDEWRVLRLSRSEVSRSSSMSGVDAMRSIQEQTGASIEKSMLHTGSDAPCEFCAARLGVWYPVDSIMIEKNSVFTGAEGGMIVYNWDDNDGHDIHANGHCVPTYRVAR